MGTSSTLSLPKRDIVDKNGELHLRTNGISVAARTPERNIISIIVEKREGRIDVVSRNDRLFL